MSIHTTLWPQLRDKETREEFIAQFSRQSVGVQIAALIKQHGLSQTQLAERSGLTQGVISRAADPSYGKVTLRTLVRIAAGLDVAFMPMFVPFSELPKWFDRLESVGFKVPTFVEEDAAREEAERLVASGENLSAELNAEEPTRDIDTLLSIIDEYAKQHNTLTFTAPEPVFGKGCAYCNNQGYVVWHGGHPMKPMSKMPCPKCSPNAIDRLTDSRG